MPKKTQSQPTAPQPDAPPTPRPTSKFAVLIAELQRPEGATVARLSELTGWLPNSVRGAMSGGLKKRFGLTIISVKRDGQRTYRIPAVE